MTKYCATCVVCGTSNGGSFTHHSNWVGRNMHSSTAKTCRIVKLHCVGCCRESA